MGWSPNLFAPLCSVGNTLILNSPTTSMRKSYNTTYCCCHRLKKDVCLIGDLPIGNSIRTGCRRSTTVLHMLTQLPDYFRAYPTAFIIASTFLGIIIGSFLNVVIVRLPVILERNWQRQCAELWRETGLVDSNAETSSNAKSGKQAPFNLLVPRSRCPSCGHTLSVSENIPIISYTRRTQVFGFSIADDLEIFGQ